jgi:hypothetical protein
LGPADEGSIVSSILDWWGAWWPVVIPFLLFLVGAVWAFAWLDSDGEDDDEQRG